MTRPTPAPPPWREVTVTVIEDDQLDALIRAAFPKARWTGFRNEEPTARDEGEHYYPRFVVQTVEGHIEAFSRGETDSGWWRSPRIALAALLRYGHLPQRDVLVVVRVRP